MVAFFDAPFFQSAKIRFSFDISPWLVDFNQYLTCFQHWLYRIGLICEDHTSPNILYKVYSGFHPGIMGRSNNSHKIFPRIFWERTVDYKQGGVSPRKILLRHPHICSRKGMVKLPPRSPRGHRMGMPGGWHWVYHASLMNSFFSLWMVATDTLVSFDATLML